MDRKFNLVFTTTLLSRVMAVAEMPFQQSKCLKQKRNEWRAGTKSLCESHIGLRSHAYIVSPPRRDSCSLQSQFTINIQKIIKILYQTN